MSGGAVCPHCGQETLRHVHGGTTDFQCCTCGWPETEVHAERTTRLERQVAEALEEPGAWRAAAAGAAACTRELTPQIHSAPIMPPGDQLAAMRLMRSADPRALVIERNREDPLDPLVAVDHWLACRVCDAATLTARITEERLELFCALCGGPVLPIQLSAPG